MRLFLCGDLMLGRGVDQILPHPGSPRIFEPFIHDAREYRHLAEAASGSIDRPVPPAYIWGDALTELERAAPHARIANLETAITQRGQPWPGKSIQYRMHPGNVPALTAASIDCCILANNHVLDWGPPGLTDTLESLQTAGITAVGAGLDAAHAAQPAILNAGNSRLGVIASGLADSGIPPDWAAEANRPGINRLPDLSSHTAARLARQIEDLRPHVDAVLVSLHWGPNWGYAIPDEQRAFARHLIDAGAAIIHGHSSHHPKGIEFYARGAILYGCGDLINDYEGIAGHQTYRPDLTLLYLLELTPDGTVQHIRGIPMRLRRMRLQHATEHERAWLAERLGRECRHLASRLNAPAATHELHIIPDSTRPETQ